MRDRLVTALAGLAAGGGHIQKVMDLPRMAPDKRSLHAPHTKKALIKGYNQHLKDVKGDEGKDFNFVAMHPPANQQELAIANTAPQIYASSVPAGVPIAGTNINPELPTVMLNPNANRVYAAKAMGSAISGQTQLGRVINDMHSKYGAAMQKHPLLAKALMGATFIAPASYSALVEGDNDTDEALLLASLPTAAIPLTKEIVDTYHGQRILDKSGLRTTMGQRGKLAGNLLSHLAIPILAGSAGNMVGNIFD